MNSASNAGAQPPRRNAIVGARVPRLEDRRHLAGRATFVADIRLAGMREVAFVRSAVAHGRIRGITPPPGLAPGQFWTAREFGDLIRPIAVSLTRPDFRTAPYHVPASDRVRFVGEIVAAVIADDRARAEDIAEQVAVDIEELEVLASAEAALAADAVRLHGTWPDNRYMEVARTIGDFDGAVRAAEVAVTRSFRMARLSPAPLEPRGSVAHYDARLDQLTLYMTTQRPHLNRTFLAEQLIGVDERQIRIVTPDVGGGFGGKANLYPEDVVLAAIAMRLPYPIRWLADRWESLIADSQAREHSHRITVHAKKDGEILAIDAGILADGGAYSMRPSGAAGEANMAATVLPGVYRIRNYRFKAATVCTNKTPLGPYRGVGRPSGCFAMERMIDELASVLGLEPNAVRLRNMIQPNEFPYTTATGLVYDSGDYPAMIRTAIAAMKHERIRVAQAAAPADAHQRIGVGYAIYTEQTAHGAEEWARRGQTIVAGFESARVRLHPSGTLTVDVGIHSHGQGLETTLAQIASEVTGLPYDRISVRHGDTELSPYGLGTVASRSLVTAGGATYHGCVELAAKIRKIGAALHDTTPDKVTLEGGFVVGPKGSIPFSEIANAAYLNIQRLPRDVTPGLEVLHAYRPPVETGAYAAGVHAAKVSVDLDTGAARILDYVVVEDCGRAVNPVIVDGQVLGGLAQGIGQALYEEIRHSDVGQPMNVTFADYLVPGASEVPDVRIEHQETLSPFTVFGMKGTGEGGAVAPPAAIANAVTDALKPFGVTVCTVPITPASIWSALAEARAGTADEVVATAEVPK
jgi:carbon-monoxide dehydrogenase large subunit